MRNANKATLKYLSFFIILGFILAATGCMSPMALNKKMQSLDTSKESIVLMTVKATNRLVPTNPLILENINTKATVSGKKFIFRITGLINFKFFKTPTSYDYLISFQLPPDEYTIWGIQGKGQFMGGFYADFKIDFYLEPNTIVYLGHMEMINRERKEGEKRSGFILPLIDQAMGGFSNGTMDISLSDNYDEDIALFKQHYPVLENYTVQKNIVELTR